MEEESKSKASVTGSNLVAKPQTSKPKNLKNLYDEEDGKFTIAPVSKAAQSKGKSSNKKKKMQIDSDN